MTNATSPGGEIESLPTVDRPVALAADVVATLTRIDLPSLAAAQVDRAARAVPAVAALPEDVLQGPFADALGRASEHVLLAFLENRAHSEEELREIANRFAEVMVVWGLTIDDIITTFAQAATVLWCAIARHAAPCQLRALLRSGGRALDSAALVERIARRAAPHADDTRITAERTARAAIAEAIDAAPRAPGPTDARIFVAVRPGADLRGHAALARELREMGFAAMTGSDHVVGSLPAGAAAPRVDGAAIVAEALPRPGSSNDRTRRLREIVVIAARHGRRGPLTDLDLVPERLLASAPAVAFRLRATAAAIASAPFGAQLLATATTFVAADGAVGATARALSLHRESVRHRIGRIQRLTGLDLGSWHGRCVLALALRAASDHDDPNRPASSAATGGGMPSATEVTSVLRAILDRVDRVWLTRRLVEHRRAAHPELAMILADADAEISSAEADAEAVVSLLCGSEPARDRTLVGPTRRTLEYLRLGMTPDDVAAVGRTTPQIVWGAILDAAIDEELRHLPAAIPRLIAYIEATQAALTDAMQPDRSNAEAALLNVLLDPAGSDQAVIAASTAAGIPIATRCRCLVILLDSTDVVPAGRIAMDLRRAGWITNVRGERIYGIAPLEVAEPRLDERLPERAVAVLGDATPLREVGRELRHLERLVDVASADGRTGPVDIMSLTLESLLIGRPDIAHALREAIVAPLERRDGALVATLRQYVAHGLQRGPSAAALHLHPNSLDHRLSVVKHEIGRTFTTIDDVLAVLLGVAAERLNASSSRPGRPP
ncbi:helix-turn-helix domain-containing protein [Conexibacter arvalis]|uniref:PucR C-terminal helix-turn-helix domain-containing protein n=1 Tax=Conexibacter arvalis TaxID=912552 RepID=A0A840I9S7_9ACTN|nr:helix-turn-helix domain-containing protein [Conexibacter arvalis]MBB4660680.1 hypothetical protein [Conexibacter arvalis]